jgi:serine/threonine protein kinase
LRDTDLKPRNVLLRNSGTEAAPDWEALIDDFGVCDYSFPVGTFEYMSPEATGKSATLGGVSNASDVFSFGVVLWEMLLGMRVRKGFSGREVGTIVVDGKRMENLQSVAEWMFDGSRPEIPHTLPPPLRFLMEACWAPTPAERIGFNVVVPALRALCLAQERGALTDASLEPEPEPQQGEAGVGPEAEVGDMLVEWIRENVGEGEAQSVQIARMAGTSARRKFARATRKLRAVAVQGGITAL